MELSKTVGDRGVLKLVPPDAVYNKKRKHGSWANLKGDGQLVTKAGNGEQILGMVPGLGSVSGYSTSSHGGKRASVLCLIYYIGSLCSGGFADATAFMCWFGVWWGHVTDVPRTGCARLGSADRRVSFYASLVGGGLRLSGPSSGSNGSVRVYRRVIFGKQNWRCARTLCS